MQVNFHVPKAMAAAIENLYESNGYSTRTEIVREALRELRRAEEAQKQPRMNSNRKVNMSAAAIAKRRGELLELKRKIEGKRQTPPPPASNISQEIKEVGELW